jgi:hypothetical protein
MVNKTISLYRLFKTLLCYSPMKGLLPRKFGSYFCFLFRRGGKATPEVRGALGDHLSQLTLGSFQVQSAQPLVFFSGTVSSHLGLFRYYQLTLGPSQVQSAYTWAFPGTTMSAHTWIFPGAVSLHFSGTVKSPFCLPRYSQLTLGPSKCSQQFESFQVQLADT